MKQKFLYLTCFAALLAGVCAAQPTNTTAIQVSLGTNTFPFAEKHDLDFGKIQGHVTLTANNFSIKAGESISMDLRLVNTGMSRDFFNPYFNPYTLPPAQIALYDGNHNYLGDLMSWINISYRGISWDDWTFVPGGGSYIGFTMTVKPNYARQPLPPGDYYLQLIYYKAFIALDPRWRDTAPAVEAKQVWLRDFEAHYDHSELFRSNPVKITITK
ncbi:MAG: hypothetical protein P4N59_08210 [Negativicutes bacterium]|nr:hypothetical protein [Negativicutes bacterium]